jgi:hypothetical protein
MNSEVGFGLECAGEEGASGVRSFCAVLSIYFRLAGSLVVSCTGNRWMFCQHRTEVCAID